MAYKIVDNIVVIINSAFMENYKIESGKGPTAAVIADWIRSQIRISRFVPGQRLVEVDLIRKTGGSRSKVREALQRLAAENLVEIEENRGASVREPSMEEIRQLYLSRAALEGLCAADFTRRATDEEKARLYTLAEEMEAHVNDGRPEKFGKLNAEWHSLIMRVSGNELIEALVRRLNTPVHHLLFESFYIGKRMQHAIEDHRRIVAAILSGDPDEAEKAMRQHVEGGHRFLITLDRDVHGP